MYVQTAGHPKNIYLFIGLKLPYIHIREYIIQLYINRHRASLGDNDSATHSCHICNNTIAHLCRHISALHIYKKPYLYTHICIYIYYIWESNHRSALARNIRKIGKHKRCVSEKCLSVCLCIYSSHKLAVLGIERDTTQCTNKRKYISPIRISHSSKNNASNGVHLYICAIESGIYHFTCHHYIIYKTRRRLFKKSNRTKRRHRFVQSLSRFLPHQSDRSADTDDTFLKYDCVPFREVICSKLENLFDGNISFLFFQ